MVSKYVYPPRNLPGTAEVWGRSVENRDEILDRKIDVQTQKTDNALRAISGQLASASSQIIELQARRTHSTQPANLQLIRGSSSGQSGPASRVVSFPPPEARGREAIIVGSGSVAWTGTPTTPTQIADSVAVGIEFRQDSSRLWFDSTQVGSTQMFSFEANPTFNLVVPVQVPLAGGGFDLRMWVASSVAGGQTNRGARLENMNFSIIYGNPL